MNTPTSFEWDDNKASSNAEKHGVRFEVATVVFSDPMRLDILDERFEYGEERRVAVGSVQGETLYVAYTMRGAVCRIISARTTHTTEGEAYHGDIHAQQALEARFQR